MGRKTVGGRLATRQFDVFSGQVDDQFPRVISFDRDKLRAFRDIAHHATILKESHVHNPFLARLMHAGHLNDPEIQAIEGMCRQFGEVGPKKYLSRDGDEMTTFPVILSGWAARFQILRNGARQITRLLLPGDAFHSAHLLGTIATDEVITLTPCRIVKIAYSEVRNLIEKFPTIGEVLRSYGYMENAILSTWIVNIGRRDALERMAHLICEAHYRLSLIDDTKGHEIDFPLTQDDLADALGLTPVHINRKVQQLRSEKLITLQARKLKILDLKSLKRIAGFDSSYLSPRTACSGMKLPIATFAA